MARQRKLPTTGKSPPPTDGKLRCILVPGDGTAEDVEARYAAALDDWAEWPRAQRDEAIRLTRQLRLDEDSTVRATVTGTQVDVSTERPTLTALRLASTFGSKSIDLANHAIVELARQMTGMGERLDSESMSAALAFIAGGKPASPIEATLLAQMWATNSAASEALRRSAKAEFLDQATAFGNLATKLLNAYTRQAETLAKMQRGAEQTVRHVHTYTYVDQRQQAAIVVPPANTNFEGPPHAQEGYDGGAVVTPLLGQDAGGNGVPVPNDAGQETMLAPRREKHGRAG